MPIDSDVADGYASLIMAAQAAGAPFGLLTTGQGAFDLADGYQVGLAVTRRRKLSGEVPVGWKIGFTNSALWADQGLDSPIWAPMYDKTVSAADAGASVDITMLSEPRIEPEIGLRLSRVPTPEMDEPELLACIDGVTHGFEIVQSIYPGWKLKPPDAVAAFGMHARYRHGPIVPIAEAERARWPKMLVELTVVLFRDGVEMDRGVGTNVLGGPLSALRYFVSSARKYPGYELKAGDLITTGTLTKALPIKPGETWSTEISGAPLAPLKITLT